MKKDNIRRATLAAILGQSIFGLSFMFTKIALDEATPMVVIADRYIIAFLTMTIAMLCSDNKIKLKGKRMHSVILMALFQPTLYFICESYGLKLTTSSFSAVMVALIPVITMISGIFILKEIPTVWQYIFTVISVFGVIIMTLQGKANGTVTTAGVIFLIISDLGAVGYNIMSRKISTEFTAFERTYAMAFIGMVSFIIMALVESSGNIMCIIAPFDSMSYTASLLYLGIVSSVVAFFMLNYANTYLPVAKSTAFSNLTTIISVVAGVLFMHEPFNLLCIIASAMIVFGVWGTQSFGRKEE